MTFTVILTIHEWYHKRFEFRTMRLAADFMETLLTRNADNESMKIEIEARENETCDEES